MSMTTILARLWFANSLWLNILTIPSPIPAAPPVTTMISRSQSYLSIAQLLRAFFERKAFKRSRTPKIRRYLIRLIQVGEAAAGKRVWIRPDLVRARKRGRRMVGLMRVRRRRRRMGSRVRPAITFSY